MYKNWHTYQITIPKTQEPLLPQKKGSYTRVFTLLRLLLAGIHVFLSFTFYLPEKQITVLNVQFLYLLRNQFPGF